MMVITMLEARVDAERESDLTREYGSSTAEVPAHLVETFLLQADDTDLWRIVTVWRSRQELDDYRESVETPEGVRIFRAAGAEPTLTIFEVAAHASHDV